MNGKRIFVKKKKTELTDFQTRQTKSKSGWTRNGKKSPNIEFHENMRVCGFLIIKFHSIDRLNCLIIGHEDDLFVMISDFL